MIITHTPNHRVLRARHELDALQLNACQGAGMDPDALPDLFALLRRYSYHLDQHRARLARRMGREELDGTPASFAVELPVTCPYCTDTSTYGHICRHCRRLLTNA